MVGGMGVRTLSQRKKSKEGGFWMGFFSFKTLSFTSGYSFAFLFFKKTQHVPFRFILFPPLLIPKKKNFHLPPPLLLYFSFHQTPLCPSSTKPQSFVQQTPQMNRTSAREACAHIILAITWHLLDRKVFPAVSCPMKENPLFCGLINMDEFRLGDFLCKIWFQTRGNFPVVGAVAEVISHQMRFLECQCFERRGFFGRPCS